MALESKVEELERELSVWKSAFKNAEEEKKVLNKAVVGLERKIDSLKVRGLAFVRAEQHVLITSFATRMTIPFTYV